MTNSVELWDAYDKEGNKLDKILVRGDDIPSGMYHLVCDVLVCHVDGDILLMQRSFDKANRPGEYDASAGGSAYTNEDSDKCARRELYEETGISANELSYVGRYFNDITHSMYDRYICVVDMDKDDIVLQSGETVSYKWVSLEEFKVFINSIRREDKRHYYEFVCEKYL